MKRTGPTNENTRKLALQLEKHAKTTKAGVYHVLAEQMRVPTRQRAEVNLDHLNEMALLYKDKVLVVPGKILATGTLTHPIHVAAFRISATAKEKIAHAKGSAMTLDEMIEKKTPVKNMILVK